MFFLSILAVILVACVVLWIVNLSPFDGVLKKIFNTAITGNYDMATKIY
jgi:hypothetical protein